MKNIILQVAGGIFLVAGTVVFTLLVIAAISLHNRVTVVEAEMVRVNREITTLIGWTADLQTNVYELRRR